MPLIEIPIIERLQISSVSGVKKTGHTKAIEVTCQNDDENITCILKPFGDLPLGRHTCARELIGSILGVAFGFRVPTPYIIDITENCHLLTNDGEIKQRLINSQGLNFGCKYIENEILIANFVEKDKLDQAAQIFAFDMLIQNDDRRCDNANMFQDKLGFIIFDHEMAFPYSRPDLILGVIPNPWEFDMPGSINYRNHFCYKFLKHERFDISKFRENLIDLGDTLPDIIFNRIPAEWNGEEIARIVDYLSQASLNADQFIHKVNEVLA